MFIFTPTMRLLSGYSYMCNISCEFQLIMFVHINNIANNLLEVGQMFFSYEDGDFKLVSLDSFSDNMGNINLFRM